METKITIYTNDDIKKSGGFKIKNSVVEMGKEDFFKYLNENNLNIKSDYIDYAGDILNSEGEKFKRFSCSYGGLIIGVSGIVKDFI